MMNERVKVVKGEVILNFEWKCNMNRRQKVDGFKSDTMETLR
jgi:hypothetical protein